MLADMPHIPEGTRGRFRVVHVLGPGDVLYPALFEDEEVWMSLAPQELASQSDAVRAARGRVLTAGLGLGYFLRQAAAKDEVTAIHVVEVAPEVVDLMWPHVRTAKASIEMADIFRYTPRDRFDLIFLDVLGDYAPEHLILLAYLRHRFQRFLRPGGTLLLWKEKELRRQLAAKLRHVAQAHPGGGEADRIDDMLLGPWRRWLAAGPTSDVAASARQYARLYGSAAWARQWRPTRDEAPWLSAITASQVTPEGSSRLRSQRR
jgi:trans-aconitate methyltransferase